MKKGQKTFFFLNQYTNSIGVNYLPNEESKKNLNRSRITNT